MVERYEDFLERINSFEKPELLINVQELVPRKSLLDKVKEDNTFNDFFGDTVVFDLDTETKEKVFLFIEILYQFIPECFCEKLKKDTLHLTLHDLSNSTQRKKIERIMRLNEIELRQLMNFSSRKSIQMETNYVVNMVDTSLVLAVKPVSKEDYLRLMAYYELIDSIYQVNYKFTPHITLAYYNRNGFDETSVNELKKVVKSLNQLKFEFPLNPSNLVYQHFKTMNDYKIIFYLMGNR